MCYELWVKVPGAIFFRTVMCCVEYLFLRKYRIEPYCRSFIVQIREINLAKFALDGRTMRETERKLADRTKAAHARVMACSCPGPKRPTNKHKHNASQN